MTATDISARPSSGLPEGEPALGNGRTSKPVSERSALRRLRLTAEDLDALREQGSIHPERRDSGTYYKLYFRRGGRQLVRYIGDQAAAREVQAELDRLQSSAQRKRALARSIRDARRGLRAAKAVLEPVLASHGYRFHGYEFRKRKHEHPGPEAQ